MFEGNIVFYQQVLLTSCALWSHMGEMQTTVSQVVCAVMGSGLKKEGNCVKEGEAPPPPTHAYTH